MRKGYGSLGGSKPGNVGRMGGSSTRSMEEIRKEARTPFARPAGAPKPKASAPHPYEYAEPSKKRGRRA